MIGALRASASLRSRERVPRNPPRGLRSGAHEGPGMGPSRHDGARARHQEVTRPPGNVLAGRRSRSGPEQPPKIDEPREEAERPVEQGGMPRSGVRAQPRANLDGAPAPRVGEGPAGTRRPRWRAPTGVWLVGRVPRAMGRAGRRPGRGRFIVRFARGLVGLVVLHRIRFVVRSPPPSPPLSSPESLPSDSSGPSASSRMVGISSAPSRPPDCRGPCRQSSPSTPARMRRRVDDLVPSGCRRPANLPVPPQAFPAANRVNPLPEERRSGQVPPGHEGATGRRPGRARIRAMSPRSPRTDSS